METRWQWKTRFEREGRAILGDVRRQLKAHGFTETRIHYNRGGIAVSGEVSLEAFRPGEAFGAYAWVQENIFSREGTLVLIARWTERRQERRHTRSGRNMDFVPGSTSTDVATFLLAEVDSANATDGAGAF